MSNQEYDSEQLGSSKSRALNNDFTLREILKMFHPRHVFLFCLMLLGGLQSGYAANTEGKHPYLEDTFFVDVGIFLPDRRLGLAVDGSGGQINDPIEFEESVRFKKSEDVFSLEFGWRFGEKWRLVGQYFESSGSSSWVLEEDVEWEDLVFLAGTNANAGAEFLVMRGFFARDFNVGEKHEFGLGAGIHWLDIGAHIEGTVIVEGGGTETARESVGVSGPLPNIGVWYNYSISDRWAFRFRNDYFSANIGKYDGSMVNLALGVNFQIARNFGIGLDYNHFDLDVDIDESDWRGHVDTSYEGLFAHLSFYW